MIRIQSIHSYSSSSPSSLNPTTLSHSRHNHLQHWSFGRKTCICIHQCMGTHFICTYNLVRFWTNTKCQFLNLQTINLVAITAIAVHPKTKNTNLKRKYEKILMLALRKVASDKVWNLGDFRKKSMSNTKKS